MAHTAAAPPTARTLVIGVKKAPSFLIKNDDSTLDRISVALCTRIAGRMNVTYRLQETDIAGSLDGLVSGALDLTITPLTITAERESRVDFSQPFYASGLAIAVRSEHEGRWRGAIAGVLSAEFVEVVVALFVVLLVSGFLMWLSERRTNAEQFDTARWRALLRSYLGREWSRHREPVRRSGPPNLALGDDLT